MSGRTATVAAGAHSAVVGSPVISAQRSLGYAYRRDLRGGALRQNNEVHSVPFCQLHRLITTNKFFVGISMFDILVLLIDANVIETV